MKTITLIIGLLVVGCGETYPPPMPPEKTDTNESTPSTNTNEVDGTTAKPVKELTLEEKVVGTYALPEVVGQAETIVFLENGNLELYDDGKKQEGKGKWSIVGKEIHVEQDKVGGGRYPYTEVARINKDGSLTNIAKIDKDGKRTDYPKEDQQTYKKIK